ncbi:hypothetical protein FRC09_001257 [Ceratobasidium sp. 395]|nr:hypothetical protein FRC09_001257 [Ceratobasidium sp. 395]
MTRVRSTPVTASVASHSPAYVQGASTVNYEAIEAGTNASQQGDILHPPVGLYTPTLLSWAFLNLSDIQSDGIPDVDACSTGPELRQIIADALAKPWSLATRSYPLTDDIWTLQNKSDVDLVTLYPDTPTFYSACLANSGASGKLCFTTGKTMKVTVMLTVAVYTEIQAHTKESSNVTEQSPIPRSSTPEVGTGYTSNRTLSPRPSPVKISRLATLVQQTFLTLSRVNEGLHVSTAIHPATPTKLSHKRPLVLSPTSVVQPPTPKCVSSGSLPLSVLWERTVGAMSSPEKLANALWKQGADIQHSGFFPLAEIPMANLVSLNGALDFSNTQLALTGVINFDIRHDNDLGSGSFKKCILGRLILHAVPATGLGSTNLQVVALKRPCCPDSTPNQPKLFSPGDELRFVTKEAIGWQWGSSLYILILDYIKNHERSGDEGELVIPPAWFVKEGVAKLITANAIGENALSGAILVEEHIPSDQVFTHFIGNGSALPCIFSSGLHEHLLAQFFSFCQHVQWVVTGGQVYCSDWQGGSSGSMEIESLLTDPQIMTHPELGDKLFAGGSIAEAFNRFTLEHERNENPFCQFYEPDLFGCLKE